jgi:hypothetical protein
VGCACAFRGLADPLGLQVGVQLEGGDAPSKKVGLGQAALFVPDVADQDSEDDDDDDVPNLVPVLSCGIQMHQDEILVPDANRLMELWKGEAKTKPGEPGVTSLGFYDVFHDEIVILQAVDGMRIRVDMCGFHEVPHFVPGGLVRGGGGYSRL